MSARRAGRGREESAGHQYGTPGSREAYVTDLVLGLLDPLEFGCVCHHTEAFALVLLKLLLVTHLEDQRVERDWSRGTGSREGPSLQPSLRQQPARRETLTRNPPAVTSTSTPQLKAQALAKKY